MSDRMVLNKLLVPGRLLFTVWLRVIKENMKSIKVLTKQRVNHPIQSFVMGLDNKESEKQQEEFSTQETDMKPT